ncbi:hypothetical protein [Azohydromonas caseinilytica]|uniref:Uncharacterized protein n=1 Tax=Azohydromonas caseinilytica TaxID=2728836 RepID=A0A848F3T7_9BURK|nr:hypothetical protein [Azohydromonas caseinilytica]NML14052.1 hypothetical protein [Azohydromonas caseinilytica]
MGSNPASRANNKKPVARFKNKSNGTFAETKPQAGFCFSDASLGVVELQPATIAAADKNNRL